MTRVLVVDDEEGVRSYIAEALTTDGVDVSTAADGQEAVALLDRQAFHLVITDLKMPRLGGMELLQKIRSEIPETEVIVLTAYGTIDSAVLAMKLGALDYLSKPISSPDELRLLVRRALETRTLRQERVRRLHNESALASLIAVDPAMLAVVDQIRRVATTDATVLLLGESGTGKEVAARALHDASQRHDNAFVAVSCAAITESLLESEIFGHEKGAFTGANETRRGRFELADGGTLFLDEIGELAPKIQAKLLRVLEERTFERVGGSRAIAVDVRVIAATNRNLNDDITHGRFRLDLYHRLSVFPIHLPPLRQRPADIIPLAEHLLAKIASDQARPRLTLTPSAAATLQTAPWPGNVRELRNTLERAAILCDGNTIDVVHISQAPTLAGTAESDNLRDLERRAIEQALARTNGHRKQAAERLGIGLRTLYEKIKEYGLSK